MLVSLGGGKELGGEGIVLDKSISMLIIILASSTTVV